MTVAQEDGYRAPQVCKIVGITYRQLDYWARTGLLTPSIQTAQGSGSQRLYSFQDVVQLRVIKRLLDAGMSLKKIRQAMEILRQQFRSDRPLADVTLLSGSLAPLPRALDLAAATMRVVRQNLALAFAYNVVAIPVAAGLLYPLVGHVTSPMLAAAAMTLSSLSVIANSLRLRGQSTATGSSRPS